MQQGECEVIRQLRNAAITRSSRYEHYKLTLHSPQVVTPNAVKFNPHDGWVGVGVTYEDATKTISLYVDGVVQVKERTNDRVKPQTIDHDLHIGVGVDSDATFTGQISSFAVFGTALDEQNMEYVNSLR